LLLSLQIGQTRVATDRGNQLVSRRGLGSREPMGVEPLLEVGLGPRRIQPVSGIGSRLAGALSSSLVVGSSLLENSVSRAGLRNYVIGVLVK
jgi:hypothetical protein